jgi:hypothetical protein
MAELLLGVVEEHVRDKEARDDVNRVFGRNSGG